MAQASDLSPDAPRFPGLPAQIDLPAIVRELLGRWEASNVFEHSVKQTEGGQPWTFYEGPPTANGMPGVHHVEARVFKYGFPRVKTTTGVAVQRPGCWVCCWG